MKTLRFYFLILVLTLLIITFQSPYSRAVSDNKSDSSSKNYAGDQVFLNQSLAAPTLSAAAFRPDHGFSLLKKPIQIGFEGELNYELLQQNAVRLKYQDIAAPVSFFWIFDQTMDLRDRWLEIIYSGLGVPNRIFFTFEEFSLKTEYPLYLENSLKPRSGFFKLPNLMEFGSITALKILIKPEDLVALDADFVIHDVQLMEGAGPLSENWINGNNDFFWFPEPLKAKNIVELNPDFSF